MESALRVCSLPLLLGAATSVVVVGCSAPRPGPEVLEISPDKGWTGEATDVVISGARFFPTVQAEARGDGAEINRSFEAWLTHDGERVADLDRVALTDSTELTAQVPAGIAYNIRYDLVVAGPSGEQGVLEDAFLVTETQADHFVLTAVEERESWTVQDQARFELQVVDPAGNDLYEAIVPVRISVEPTDSEPIDVIFEPDILLDQRTARSLNGAAIEGNLDRAGRADIDFTVRTPAGVLLKVESLLPGVEDETLDLLWTTGTDYTVQVTLPEPNYRTSAGSEFPVRLTLLDEHAITVWDPLDGLSATLVDNCGDVRIELPNFAGIVDVDVTPKKATGTTSCEVQWLELELRTGELGQGERFSSPAFTVDAGPVSEFDVAVGGTEVVAGQRLTAIAFPVDAYGNASPWSGDAAGLEVTDTVGDVQRLGCDGGDTFVTCLVTPTDAERGVQLVVRDPVAAVEGRSQPYDVLPAGLDRLVVTPDPDDIMGGLVAGETLSVAVSLLDEFDNDVATDAIAEGDITLRDSSGEDLCTYLGPGERGQIDFECEHRRAHPLTSLVATGPNGTTASSVAYAVINADLFEVSIAPGATSVIAGDPLEVVIVGFDRFGNPYKVHTDNRVDLADTSGSLSVDHALLDTDGRSVDSVSFTKAGPTAITASQFGNPLGESMVIDVSAGTATQLGITVDEPWVWVDGTATVLVQAQDRYGNPADSDEGVTVSSTAGTFDDASLTLVDGEATAAVEFSFGSLAESIQGTSDTGLLGSSRSLYVVQDCGSFGPTADMDFAGDSDAVVCHDGAEGGTTASFSGSSAGSSALSRYALWVDGQSLEYASSASVSATINDVGIFETRGLVVDDSLCADEVVTDAFVGPDDGQPVGRLDASLSKSTLASGSGTTTVSLSGVKTCDGGKAAAGRVYFRTDRGEITGAAASGTGLRLTLDSSGDGSVTLDATSADTDGSGTVTLWVESGAAAGGAEFTISGDTRRPRIINQDPVGYTTESVEVITLTFSESVSPSTIVPSAFSVTGGSIVTIDEVLRSGDREVEVWLDSPVSGSSATWTVEADSSITDINGNALDGAWTGLASDHTATFGDVSSSAPDVTRCGAPKAFRPDGDDGSGIEADTIDVKSTADATVGEWWWSVVDGDGDEVWVGRVAGGSTSGTMTWDGTAFDGAVVEDGTYVVRVSAANAHGTLGDWCSVKVSVDNRRGL